jgi:uncharacterized membrane protein
MNIALWILQIMLAAAFLTTGSIKVVITKEKLAKAFEWVDDYSENKIKIIGTVELIGALGLFLPGVSIISAIIIPLSALGLSVIMIMAAIAHFKRKETEELIVNVLLFSLLLVVAVTRLLL